MLFAVLSGYLLALAAPHLVRQLRDAASWVLALLPLALFAWFASLVVPVAHGQVLQETLSWVPGLGAALTFRLDGLSLLFALLVTGVGGLVTVYSGTYLHGDERLGTYHASLLAFMASMLGLVLAGNLVTLFVAWELTSLTSFLLIGFDHHRAEARKAALQALLVNGGGGLALMAGLLTLGHAADSWEIGEILQRGERVRESAHYLPILVLVLAGAFTKSAQVPFHFWLPRAMEAPTPVSAYLHSATMVKAGIYLLARFLPVLGGTTEWHVLVGGVGGATLAIGAVVAFRQTDLKLLLAWSTVSALGMATLLAGLGTAEATRALAALILAHALYKGALFLVAGIVDHQAGTRDVRELRGLSRAMPLTAAAALVAAASMAGVPLLLGFVSKELLYEAARPGFFAIATCVLASMLLVAVAGMAGLAPFYGARMTNPPDAREASWGLLAGPMALSAFGLLFGLAPGAAAVLVGPAASVIHGSPVEQDLALWHGFGATMFLSVVTIGAGVLLLLGRAVLREASQPLTVLAQAGPARIYGLLVEDGLVPAAKALTRAVQGDALRNYLLAALATVVALVGTALWSGLSPDISLHAGSVLPHEVLLSAAIVAGALLAATTTSRLAAVAGVGVAGYGIAVLFLLFGAPDLAMTMFAVETLSVVLLVLVLHRLPRFAQLSSRAARARDAAAAGACGLLLGSFVLLLSAEPLQSRLAPWLAAHALELGRGRNVVNVVLVDVRAFDTLGEIVVLVAAALGVLALLRLRPRAEEVP